MRTIRPSIFVWTVAVTALGLGGCAPTRNPLEDTAIAECVGCVATSAGFWLGLWHGVIAPITFVISLFSANVGLYEVHNSGGWYHAGFMLGLSISLGASARGGCRDGWRRKPR